MTPRMIHEHHLVCSVESGKDGFPGPHWTVIQLIEWLNERLSLVPAEYRNHAICEIEGEGWEEALKATIRIYYPVERPETESERVYREKREQETIANGLAYRREQYERLRAEFEP